MTASSYSARLHGENPAFEDDFAATLLGKSGDEFSLNINNHPEPKILVVDKKNDRQNIYGATLGLYNSRIVKLEIQREMLKSSRIRYCG